MANQASIALAFSLALISLSTGCSHNNPVANAATSPNSHNAASFEPSLTKSELTQHLRQHANSWQGVPYLYGGQDKSGIDCSSFIQTTFNELMHYPIPRSTKSQSVLGEQVTLDNLQAGDLVFFKTGFKQRHVGIYIEQGQFVHASTSKGVIISRLDNPYWHDNFWQSRRVAPLYLTPKRNIKP